MVDRRVLVVALAFFGATALADEVELVSGEVMKGTNVVVCDDGRVEMDHPVLGHLDLAAADVKAVRRDGDLSAAISSVPTATPATTAAVTEKDKTPKWKFHAELGVTGTAGNTRTTDVHGGVGALFEEPTSRWKFDGEYTSSRSSGVTTKSQWYAQGLKDWMWVGSPWLYFAQARYDRDRFQQWTSRLTVSTGPGYKLVDEKDVKVRLRAGIAGTREWGSDDSRWRPEAMGGVDGSWQINEAQNLEFASTYYRDLRDTNRYRVLSSLSWSIKLQKDGGLSLKAGVEHEYDTHRHPPFKKTDIKYFVALLYEF